MPEKVLFVNRFHQIKPMGLLFVITVCGMIVVLPAPYPLNALLFGGMFFLCSLFSLNVEWTYRDNIILRRIILLNEMIAEKEIDLEKITAIKITHQVGDAADSNLYQSNSKRYYIDTQVSCEEISGTYYSFKAVLPDEIKIEIDDRCKGVIPVVSGKVLSAKH